MIEETAGQKLRRARQSRSLSLLEAASGTRIKEKYLQAIEDDRLDAVPSMAQARGFLRIYASYLGLDAASLLNSGASGTAAEPAPQPKTEGDGTARPAPGEFLPGKADEIFIDLGSRLSRQRELLGLSLEDVVRHTHLRRHYLQALEEGNLSDLPSPVQGRGMLNNYAIFLGMDPDPLLLRFAEGLQARLTARRAAAQETPTRKRSRGSAIPRPVKRLLSGDIFLGGTLAVFLLVFLVWGAIRVFSMRQEQGPSETAPSVAEVLLATFTPTATVTPEKPASTPVPGIQFPEEAEVIDTTEEAEAPSPTPPLSIQGVNLYLNIQQRSWLRVTIDGEIEFEGRVVPGSAYTYNGDRQIELLAGNGAAVNVTVNGQDLGPLGSYGEISYRLYTREGEVLPTATVTPTPTVTPPATGTPTPGTAPAEGISTAPALP